MSTIIALLPFLSLAAAQIPTGVSPTGSPPTSGFPGAPAGNFSSCPASVASLCEYTGQTTFCYDSAAVLYTITCGLSFSGSLLGNINSGASQGQLKKFKRSGDAYFGSPNVRLADCTAACDERPACLAFNVLDGASCELVGSITGTTFPGEGFVGAYKGYWSYNSAIPDGSSNGTIPTAPSSGISTGSPETTSSETTTSSAPPSVVIPAPSDNATTPVDGPTALPSTTLPPYAPSGVNPSGGFGFPSESVSPVSPIGTDIPSGPDGPSFSCPPVASLPNCESVACSLSGTPSIPFCHDAQNQLWTINCGLEFHGATELTVPDFKATLGACDNACDNVVGCQAVNFGSRSATCTLVSGVTGIEYVPGVIGAWKGCWPSFASNSTAPHAPGTAPAGTAPISTGVSLSTGVTAPVGTAPGSFGFPTVSVNSSSGIVGPTGVSPTGGSFPTGGIPFPTGAFPPHPSGGAGPYPSCEEASCEGFGTAYCTDAQGQVYTLNCGLKFKGTIGLNTTSNSLASCEATCDGLPRCLAFNFGFGQCEFLYTVSGIEVPAPGWTGAWRGIWQGGAPGGAPPVASSGAPVNSANISTVSVGPISGSPTPLANVTTTPLTSSAPSTTPSAVIPPFSNGSLPIGPTGFPTSGHPSIPSGGFPSGGTCGEGATYVKDSAGQLYTLNCGMKFTGPSYNISAASLDACELACDAAAKCLGVNFNPAGTRCQIVTIVTGVQYPAFGWTAAWKGYWAGGAPSIPSSGAPSNSVNATVPVTSSVPTTSSSSSLSSSSSVTIPVSPTSGFPSNSANSSFPVGPTGFPSPPTNGSSCPGSNATGQSYITDNNGQLYTVNANFKFTGVIAAVSNKTSSFETCAEYCDSIQCLGFNYAHGSCEFISAVYGVEKPACGWTGAWKGLWAGGAPTAPASSGIPTNSANATVTLSSSSLPTTSSSVVSTSSSSLSSSTPALPSSGFPSITPNGTAVGPTGFPSQPTGFPSPPGNASCGSATYYTDNNGQLYTVNSCLKFTGAVSTTLNSSASLETCAEKCDSLPVCLGFNYHGASCEFISSVYGIERIPGWTGAWKGIWAGGAPGGTNGSIPAPRQNATTSSVSSSVPVTTSSVTVGSSTGFPVPSPNATTSGTVSVGPISTGLPSSPNSTYPLCPTSVCASGLCVDETEQLYSLTCNSAFLGTFMHISTSRKRDTASPTLLDCEAACDGETSCIALNYDGACAYLSAVTGIETVDRSIAAWKGYWGANSTTPGGNGSFPGFPLPSNGTFPSGPNGTVPVHNTTSVAPATTSASLSSSSSSTLSTTSNSVLSSPSVSSIVSANTTSGLPSPTGTPGMGSCSSIHCVAPFQQSFCQDAAGQMYTTTCGIAFEGTFIDRAPESGNSLLACEAICDSQMGCIALNFADGQCSYLLTVTGVEPKNGSIAAWKGFWHGGAPSNGTSPFPIPSNGTVPISGFPTPSTNATSSVVGPITVSASTTSVSSTSVSSSSSLSSSSSPSVSVPVTTGSPSKPANSTSCSNIHCMAPFQQSFCADDAGQTYTITCGVAFEGSPLALTGSGSLLDCEAVCDSSSACIALNHEASQCIFLSAVSGIEQKNGSTAAWKGVWVGGVPGNGGFPTPSNETSPPISGFPTPSTNATSSTPVAPITTSASLLSSSPVTSSVSSSTSSSVLSTSSSVSSATPSGPISTGSPGGDGPHPGNNTVGSCDSPNVCAAGYGLGKSSFCKDNSAQIYTITCGIEFVGPSISNASASSLSLCQNQCDASATCIALNYIDGSVCVLVSAIYGVVNAPDSTAAYKGIWAGGAPGGNTTIPGQPGQNTTVGPITASSTAPVSTGSSSISSSSSLSISSSSLETTSSPSSTESTSSVSATNSSSSSSVSTTTSSSAVIASPTAAPNATYPLCSLATDWTTCPTDGPSYCSDLNGVTWTLTCAAAFDGALWAEEAVIKRQVSAATSTLLSCQDTCDHHGDCVALNFADNACTLLSTITGLHHVDGSLAAYKGYWASGAPVPVTPTGPISASVSSSSVLSTSSGSISSSTVSSSASTTSSLSSSLSVSSESSSSSTVSSSSSSTPASATIPSTTSSLGTSSASQSTSHSATRSTKTLKSSSTKHSSTKTSSSSKLSRTSSHKPSTTSSVPHSATTPKTTTSSKLSTSSTHKPSTTTKHSTSSTHKPSTTSKLSTTSSHKPSTTSSMPHSATTPKTTTSSHHSTTSTHKPSTSSSTKHSTSSTHKPSTTTKHSTSSTHKPVTSSSSKHSTTFTHKLSTSSSVKRSTTSSSHHITSTPQGPGGYGGSSSTKSASKSSSSPVDPVTASTSSKPTTSHQSSSSHASSTKSATLSMKTSTKPASTSTKHATTSSKPTSTKPASTSSAKPTPTPPSKPTPPGYGKPGNPFSSGIFDWLKSFGKAMRNRKSDGGNATRPNFGRFGPGRGW